MVSAEGKRGAFAQPALTFLFCLAFIFLGKATDDHDFLFYFLFFFAFSSNEMECLFELLNPSAALYVCSLQRKHFGFITFQ